MSAGGILQDPESQHPLRTLVPYKPAQSVPPPAPLIQKQHAKILELHALASTLGHACSPLMKLRKSLGTAIAQRMRQREGKFVWQTGTGHVENFPRSAALQIMQGQIGTQGRGGRVDWEASSMMEVAALMGPLLSKSTSFSAGATKALLTASERVVRVVATVIPTAKLWWRERQGVDCLYFEFQYVLADEAGELHAPKDENRNEIAFELGLETAIRQQILADVLAMADAGAPMSPGFLQQLGRLDEAAAVEARLHRRQEMPAPAPMLALNSKKQRRSSRTTWEVECILDQQPATRTSEPTFLVRWEGYHPSWECYRATGNPGEPVTTWEPLSFLQNNLALQAWDVGA